MTGASTPRDKRDLPCLPDIFGSVYEFFMLGEQFGYDCILSLEFSQRTGGIGLDGAD